MPAGCRGGNNYLNSGHSGTRTTPYFVGCLSLILFLLNAWGMRSSGSSERTIRLKIALDENVILSGVRREEIKSLLVSAGGVFRREFGLRFLVKTHESWRPDKGARSPSRLLCDLRKKVARGDSRSS